MEDMFAYNPTLLQRLWPFKGQKGQDRWVVFSALPLRFGGYFLDLAAADGVHCSNTWVLERVFGWQGLCIEPNYRFFEKLRQTRRCAVDPTVISDRRETVRFRVDNGQLGGIVADDTDNSERLRAPQLRNARIVERQADTLEAVLQKHDAPQEIDYFSLDVEGAEERIISAFDFSRYRFNCLTVERPTPRVNEVLFDNGYVFVRNHRFDTYYVHGSLAARRRIRCEPFEQVPPKTR